MLDDAFANLKCEIQSRKVQITLFELLHDSQRMQVVVEAIAVIAHQLVQTYFAGMPKWRMSDVVHERLRHSSGNLCHFDGMREAIPEMIGVAGGKDLCFGL